jgi:hypothetical protein
MSCTQTLSGISRDCLGNNGGIRKVWLANFDNVSSLTVSAGAITAITMANSEKFKLYEFPRNTSSLSSNYAVNAENGTSYVETDLLMVFTRMDTSKRLEIVAIAQGNLVAIVEDNNGNKWYLGKDYPVTINAGDGLTGTARGDRNGYSVTLRDESAELPFPFTGTIPV